MSTATAQPSVLLGEITGTPTSWSATFHDGARSWAGIHGGVVIGTLLRTAAQATRATPVAVTAHLHRPAETGPADVDVATHRGGRTVTSVATTLRQDGTRATAHVVLAADAAVHRPSAWPWRQPVGEELGQDPASLARLELPVDVVPFGQHLDIRPVGASRPLAGGPLPELRAWLRLVHPVPYEPAVGAVLLDALFPSLYAIRTEPVPIPTVEFSAHFLSSTDVPEWLFIEQRTTWATTELCIDEAHLWTHEGRLIAQSRQLRRILDRPAPSTPATDPPSESGGMQ